MRYVILDDELRAIDADERYVCRRFDRSIHRAFRKVMGLIREASDERDLRSFKSLRLEKLSGDRTGQHSMRLNQQFRLILKWERDADEQTVIVIEIVDYH